MLIPKVVRRKKSSCCKINESKNEPNDDDNEDGLNEPREDSSSSSSDSSSLEDNENANDGTKSREHDDDYVDKDRNPVVVRIPNTRPWTRQCQQQTMPKKMSQRRMKPKVSSMSTQHEITRYFEEMKRQDVAKKNQSQEDRIEQETRTSTGS